MAGPVPQGQGESMLQSAPILNRLLEPVNMRLDALVRRQADPPAAAPAPPPRDPNPPNEEQQLVENNNRQFVMEQPNEQLVEPNQPLVAAEPRLLNDERALALDREELAFRSRARPVMNYDELTEIIKQSEGLGVGQRPGPERPNQFSKDGFIQFISERTGRVFAPTRTLPFNALKARALQFIRDMRQ